MNAPVVAIKRGRKFDQVLAGARDVFLRDGYEGASVDEIARTAGVSKATLYSYFPDKGILFLEVAKTECLRQADQATAEWDTDAPPRQVLSQAAGHMLRFFLSDFGLQVYRIIVAESGRFPSLGRDFYEAVPMQVRQTMMAYFRGAIARGELAIDDLELAADQFTELCKASLHGQLILGVKATASEVEIDRVIRGAVEMFLARYGAASGPARV
ncbi:TetR/AcrR family transcriptional regulator [Palleronia sp. KMU-117]|uniref:TetR/AcrR family transcriptional regulator n=1 Tax=Palleronia sp. KMU-117 TaxID=3434108 RepID=UPI003D75DAC9